MGKKARISTDAAGELRSNPFAALTDAIDRVPDGVARPPASTPEAPEPSPADIYGGKLVVRREKKGRGGKSATIIEGLRADEAELDAVAHRLRKALGCGVRVEAANIVVQGNQTDRVRAWLQVEGAARIVLGN